MQSNKIQASRYSSQGELTSSTKDITLPKKLSQAHAVTILIKKQSNIDIIKRRISALCVRDQKFNHKTINNEKKWQQKFKVREESQQIKILLDKQRKKDAERLETLRHRNLQSRVDNYYRSKNFRKEQLDHKKQSTNLERTKSRQNERMILHNRQKNIQEKKNMREDVSRLEQNAKSERSRVLLQRQQSVQESQKRQVQHLLNLGSIKDTQITKLGELEMMMVERNTSSRMAYEASIQRLKLDSKRKSSKNYYQPSQVIRSARERSGRVNNSLLS